MTSYSGNCHCGTVRYTVTLPRPLESLPTQIVKCNCSICSRNGYIMIHQPRSATVISQGSECLSEYRFGNKSSAHKFCKLCGSSLFIDPPSEVDILGINIRMLKDVEVEKLEFNFNDGKNNGISPPYQI